MRSRIPVIALTGHLGAGKTTVLNHLLRDPGSRVGVVINDFGDINVDAGLVTGQVDEPVSVAGGCLCCLLDGEPLEDALAKLSRPKLDLDVIVVEASGVAEPAALGALIAYSKIDRIRPGGVVDVVDAVEFFDTVDTHDSAPARFTAASLVVINKCDRLPEAEREEHLVRIENRVHERNPDVHVVRTFGGALDPALLFDVAPEGDRDEQLPFGDPHDDEHPHAHARAATVDSPGPVDAGLLVHLLENPPPGAYRIKGRVAVASPQGPRGYVLNLVGRSIHVAATTDVPRDSHLVAIGYDLDVDDAQHQLERALAPDANPNADGYRRLQQHRRLSA